MTPISSDECRKLIWARVYQDLLRNAIPDSRSNFDFLAFTPDFRDSSSAIARVTELPCYKSATTILVTSDNSLEQLRYRALKDGKRVLVATYRLRRGFVLLDPKRIEDARLELAVCLDGMEKQGIGRVVSLAKMRDEGIAIDMCVTGGLVFNEEGIVIWEGQSLFEVQWAVLYDMEVLTAKAPVVAVAHSCQVVEEASLNLGKTELSKSGEVQCDFVVTPERVIEVQNAVKPDAGINFDTIDPDALNNIPPLQELKGIRMMDQIMGKSGFGKGKEGQARKEQEKSPTAEEQLGIDIVQKLMRGYKP